MLSLVDFHLLQFNHNHLTCLKVIIIHYVTFLMQCKPFPNTNILRNGNENIVSKERLIKAGPRSRKSQVGSDKALWRAQRAKKAMMGKYSEWQRGEEEGGEGGETNQRGALPAKDGTSCLGGGRRERCIMRRRGKKGVEERSERTWNANTTRRMESPMGRNYTS